MKFQFIKLLLPSFFLCTFISCSEADTSNSITDPPINSASTNEAEEEKKTEADGHFEVKSGIIYYDTKNLQGEVKSKSILSFDNYGGLIKLEETIKGETSIYLYNDALKKGATLWSGKEKPIKSYSKQGEILTFCAMRSTQGFAQIDDEIIVGKNCNVYANNAKSDDGQSKLTYWQHKGIILKEINQLGMGYIFEATKFEVKPIQSSAFSLLDQIK